MKGKKGCVMALSVFDLDHTLLKVNSSYHFGSYLYRQKFFSFSKLLACLSDYACHKWLGLSIQALHTKTFNRLFKGCALSDIQNHVDQFLTEHLTSMLYQPAVQRLQLARAQGENLLILSSSPDFLVGAIARRLQVERWKATTYQVDSQGNFQAIIKVIEGQDKAYFVKDLALQMSIPFSRVTVYSDSHLDLPVLKIAGRAIGVVPDSHLKRICLQKGWEIL